MTELMKRYEKETGGRAESFDDIYMPAYQRDFLNWIIDQLTWRDPITEPPTESGRYLVLYKQGNIIRKFVADYDVRDGWLSLLDNVEIIKYLPIPKE